MAVEQHTQVLMDFNALEEILMNFKGFPCYKITIEISVHFGTIKRCSRSERD